MNDPYPSAAQLRAEARANRLLGDQEASTVRFHALVRRMIAAIAALDFPLGSPSKHFDMVDILGTMQDWLEPRDPQALEDAAADAGRDMVESGSS